MNYKKLLGAVLSAAMMFNMSGIVSAEPVQANAAVTEIPGTVSIEEEYNEYFDYITGFASVDEAIKDRTEYLGTEYHKKVSNGSEFAEAISGAREGKVKIIELTDDINLGFNQFTTEEKSKYSGFLTQYKKPQPNASISALTELGGFTNAEAQKNGVTSFKISETNGLTIFSTKGNSISYAELNINRNANDIVIRNVHFKNMWQWDDDGTQKAVGWSNLKLNSGNNIWIDHCTFDAAFDGNIDIENGASGISITWCKIGQTPEEATASGNAIYDSITFMESLYNEGKLTKGLYKNMRDAGATPEQIMQYSAYHDKCHLCGSGDKDCVDYSDTIKDSNGNIRVTLAYNYYVSIGQRLPMIRQGVGHMFNCYIDDTFRQNILNVPAINRYATSNYKMSRCINARNGACIAADTCVFNGVEQPVIGAELQGDDLKNMDARWQVFFKNAVNRSLVVNSKVVNSKGIYVGSSWDKEGVNAFTTNFSWNDKSTIGNWAWSSSITNIGTNTKEDLEKKVDSYEFEFEYNTDEKLPYEYGVLPLESVEGVVTSKAGCDIETSKTEEQWCSVYAPATWSEHAVINKVIDLIAAIGEVEYSNASKAKIEAARAAYDALTDVKLISLVKNAELLFAAEEKYAQLQAVADKEAQKAKEIAETVGASQDTIVASALNGKNGKVAGVTLVTAGKNPVAAGNGIVTVNPKIKVFLPGTNWKIAGYADERITASNTKNITEVSDSKQAKKYAKFKVDTKNSQTVIAPAANKSVSTGVYAVKLVDDKNNVIYMNIENIEFNKMIKKSVLVPTESTTEPSVAEILALKDGDSVKTVAMTLAGTEEVKSAFNANAIVWQVGAGKNIQTVKKGQVTKVTDKTGAAVAFLTVAEDGSVKILAGSVKGKVKLCADINGKTYKTAVSVK